MPGIRYTSYPLVVAAVVRSSGPWNVRAVDTADPERVTLPCTRLRATIARSWDSPISPTDREIRSDWRFWYRRSRDVETFSSTERSYVPGTRANEYPPFESEGTVCAIAPFPTGTARIVTGRFTSTEPLSKTVPCTRTGIGLNAIGTIVRSPAGCDAGIARLVYPAADTEPA